MVADAYPPMRTSCAVQMYDLGQAFIAAGHRVTMVVPVSSQAEKVHIQIQDGVQLVQVRALQTKDISYAKRAFAELINPFLMWRRLRAHPHFASEYFNGVIWYSPTIFWGSLVKQLKRYFQIPSYLILRDIFPDWAVHLGVIKKGPSYLFFKAVEAYQYRQANTIGVQSPNNLEYLLKRNPQLKNKTQVLWNWGGASNIKKPCSINLSATILAGKTICVYAGNMGVAQGIEVLFDLAASLKNEAKLGFVFVGRGSAVEKMRTRISVENLTNILIFDEIDHDQIPALYAQCNIGLLSLDLRHQTHNIPGKFITYLHAGLPVFGLVNPGNDLVGLTQEAKIGYVTDVYDLVILKEQLQRLVQRIRCDTEIYKRCQTEVDRLFSVEVAQKQMASALNATF
jgi:glycosyltransferase involved in cell wall biosynthesis